MKKQILIITVISSLCFLSIISNAQSHSWVQAKSAGGTGQDKATSVTVDASGNTYVAGYFQSNTITFGSFTLTNAGGYDDIFLVKYDANGNVLWAKSAGGTADDDATSIAVDASGNTYVAGTFESSSITFGSITLTNGHTWYGDIFVAKYDTNGNVLWAKSAGGTDYDIANSVAVDASGNTYLTGMFGSPTITFGSTTLTNVGAYNIFLTKYDAAGNVLWAKKAGGENADEAFSVAVDASGNTYLTGMFCSSSITFGSTTLTNANGIHQTPDLFLAKYDAGGNVLWAKSVGGTGYECAYSVAINASGNPYVAGYFNSSTLSFGSTTLTNAGNPDIFLAKYDAGGNVLWAKSAGGTGTDIATSVAVDNSGNPYVVGYFTDSTFTFGSTTLTNADTTSIWGSDDIFLAKYDNAGNVLWAKSAGGTGTDDATSVAVGTSGNPYVVGYFTDSTLTFGSTTLTNADTSNTSDLFLVKNVFQLNADAGIDKAIICGGTAQLNVTSDYTGTGIVSYNWSPSMGLNYVTIPNPIATVINNTTYIVSVTTPNGYHATDTVKVYVNPLTVNVNVNNTTTTCGTPVILNTTNNYTGSGMLTYNWQPSVGLSATTVSNPSANPGSATTYTVTLTTPNGCVATDQATVTLNSLPAEEICYVEFDTTTSKNSINWASNLSANIDTVYIYNEVSTNVWSQIGSVPASQTHFIDINSNPFNQSYSYKISIKDTCGIKTDSSTFHTTITLLATYDQGTNTYGFTWSAYQGLAVPNYYLYGITSSGAVTLIGSVPGNQYFYNYTNPYLGFVKYFIGFNTPVCASKTNHLVKSNFVQSIITGITKTTGINNLVSLYPNPVTDNLQIQTTLQINKAEITDITGRLLYITTSKTIDFSSFAKGVYFVRVTTEKGIAVKKFIKQ